jgi:hypothetical protein
VAKFLINSDGSTPQPHNMRHIPRPEVGTSLSGKPIKQGYASLEAQYVILPYGKMSKLFSLYDPNNPVVTITYDDPITGQSVTRSAVMHEPTIGSRETLYHKEVSVIFTRIV